MATVGTILRKVKKTDILGVAVAAIRLTQDDLADTNRARMQDGLRADGSEMPMYSYISQTVYGYPNTRIKLRDTGEFQDHIIISVNGQKIKTTSTDYKTKILTERYGGEIFGTFGVYKNAYINEFLKPAFIKLMRNSIGL